MYFAVWNGGDYLETAKNCTSKKEVRRELISLLQPEDYDYSQTRRLNGLTLEEILSSNGWQLDTSTSKF